MAFTGPLEDRVAIHELVTSSMAMPGAATALKTGARCGPTTASTSEVVKYKEGKPAHWHNLYEDECVKRDGKWLFKQRTLKILYIGVA